MPEEPGSLYKRDEDKKWREHTDRRIVNLTTAQKQTNDDIDDLSGKVADMDTLLHGARDQRDSGLVGELEAIERGLRSALAILHPDNLGRGGLINDVRELKDLAQKEQRSIDNRWKYWTAISLAVISSATLLIREWPTISAKMNPPKPQETRKRVRHIRIVLPPNTDSSSSDTTDRPPQPERSK